MDQGDPTVDASSSPERFERYVAPPFIAAEVLRQINLLEVKHKLARIVDSEIVPHLVSLRGAAQVAATDGFHPSRDDIAQLARLVLNPDIQLSTEFVQELKDGGLSMERLFVELLEPAARELGRMWDHDECDFVEVTLGVGRLQQMLSLFNSSFDLPALSDKRKVCMIAIANEPHSFGVAMVEKFLWAGGWTVRSERDVTLRQVAPLVRADWFAVVGLTASSDRHLGALAETITAIRRHSRNPAVGIMVGGPPFAARPGLAAEVGADATAANATTAVLLAQKLFDAGASVNWQGSYDRTA